MFPFRLNVTGEQQVDDPVAQAQDQRGIVGVEAARLTRGMENLYPHLSELPLRGSTAEHPRSDSRSVEGGEKPWKSFPLRLLAVKPKFTRRESFDEESEPTVVVKLWMTHHQNIDPADLTTPKKRRQDRLAGVKVL